MSRDEVNGYIDVVFDGPPDHEAGRFVEVEDPEGASVKVGEWVERDDGYWALRLRAPELLVITAVPRGDELEDHLAEMFGDDELSAPPELVQFFLHELGSRGFDVVPRTGPVS